MKPLFHEMIYDFDNIDVSAGKGYKDSGKGFYAMAVSFYVAKIAYEDINMV